MSHSVCGIPRPYPPNGCRVQVGSQSCSETQTLDIIKEFNRLYELKMREIDSEAGGDNLQAKITLQQDWIRDLTQQNEMLVQTVEELELEATDRVAMLEEKLRNTAANGSEVMQKYKDFNLAFNLDETFQKMVFLQNDIKNLCEYIKRVRFDGKWCTEGLKFYTVKPEDLIKCTAELCEAPEKDCQVDNNHKFQAGELKEKEMQLEELEKRLSELPKESDIEELNFKLHLKDEELTSVRRSMMDMRNALTIEVAEKHDVILSLRRDVQQLEEQCRQCNKQTQFKDDIIKELRKEIKQLKIQVTRYEKLKSLTTPMVTEIPETYPNNLCLTNGASELTNLKPLKSVCSKSSNKLKQMSYTQPCLLVYNEQLDQEPPILFDTTKDQSHYFPKIYTTNPQTSGCYKIINNSQQSDSSTSASHPCDLFQLINSHYYYKKQRASKNGTKCYVNNYEFYTSQKPRSKLTANKVLHEYYGIPDQYDVYGTIENFSEATAGNYFIGGSQGVPVKTFVNNFEMHNKKKPNALGRTVKKKVTNNDSCKRNQTV